MSDPREKTYCVLDGQDKLGEGIFWCHEEQVLYWVDVPLPSLLHRFDPVTKQHDVWPMPEMVTALAKRGDGTLLIVSQGGVNFFDPRHGKFTRVAAPERDRPLNRSNDGAPDAHGRFWYGTMSNNLAPDGSEIPISKATGKLYRIEPDLRIVAMDGPVGIPNSTCFSPDNRTLYFADTRLGTIFAFDFDLEQGTISRKRIFSDLQGYGYPDGSTVDADGGVWNARWGAGCVIRFAPDGTMDRVVKIPAQNVTCCAFGGAALDTLYATTSRLGRVAAELATFPQSGGVFAFRPGRAGLPRPVFAG
jgi:L-arabinonolactonase